MESYHTAILFLLSSSEWEAEERGALLVLGNSNCLLFNLSLRRYGRMGMGMGSMSWESGMNYEGVVGMSCHAQLHILTSNCLHTSRR